MQLQDLSAAALTIAQHRISPAERENMRVNAARHAVLRRMAPALRHNLASALQPIGMIAMVLQKRLQLPTPDLPTALKNVTSISALTKDAVGQCLDAMNWLAPRENPIIGWQAGATEVTDLLAAELGLRGMVVVNDVPHAAGQARQSFFREVVAGAVLALGDQQTTGGTLTVHAQTSADGAVIALNFKSNEISTLPLLEHQVHYQYPISWADVRAMADAAGARVTQQGNTVQLGVPPV